MAQRKSAPLVGVVMGSDSDWDIMRHAAAQLDAFGVAYEARVVSAHRMPDDMFEYAEDAAAARPALHHRRRRRRRAPARHARRQDDRAGAGRAGAVEVPARRGFAALDRADAEGHSRRDVRDRRGRRGQRGAVRGGDARARTDPGVAKKLAAFRAEADQHRARDARAGRSRRRSAIATPSRSRPGAWLGLLGGGQLGRMFCMAAQSLGYRVAVLDPGDRQPGRQRRRPAHPRRLPRSRRASQSSPRCAAAATTEFENVPAAALEFLARTRARHAGARQRRHRAGPHPRKAVPRGHGFAVAPFAVLRSRRRRARGRRGAACPASSRARASATTARARSACATRDEVAAAFGAMGGRPLRARAAASRSTCEVSVIVARNDAARR